MGLYQCTTKHRHLTVPTVDGTLAQKRESKIKKSQQEYNAWLEKVAYYRNTHIVELLLPVSDPFFKESLALQGATKNGHKNCMDLLCPVSDPAVALHALKNQYPHEHQKWLHLEEREIQRLKCVLEHEIGTTKHVKTQRKRKI